MSRIFRDVSILALLLLCAACRQQQTMMLGTLEWDRITVPATAAEPITIIRVQEGDRVAKEQVLMQLDAARTQARLQNAQSEVERAAQALKEMQSGARQENIREARARVESLTAQAKYADEQLLRVRTLVQQKFLSRTDLDRAIANSNSAQADLRAAQANLELLQNGTRSEQIAQAQAKLQAAQAQVDGINIDLQRLTVRAPRMGRIDSLPYKQGDQPTVGAPLAIVLVGESPIARIYVPEPMRLQIKPGDAVSVHVDGAAKEFVGTVRSIRSEPSFTPYYALNGKDAARLSFLAEINLGPDAARLPAGVPVQVSIKAR